MKIIMFCKSFFSLLNVCFVDSGTRRILQAAIDITSLPALNCPTGWVAGWLFGYLASWLVGDSGWRGWL